jgi:hypothetical protein
LVRGFPKKHVKVLENGSIRYQIFKRRVWDEYQKKKGSGGSILTVFDNGDTLNFSYQRFNVENKIAKFERVTPQKKCTISFKNGKFTCYRPSARGGAYVNFSNKFYSHGAIFHIILKKAQSKKICRILLSFARRHEFKQKLSKTKIGENVFKMCYPALGDFGFDYTFGLSKYVSRFFRQNSIKYGIKKCFGSSGNKLVRIVTEKMRENSTFYPLYMGVSLKNLIKVDDFFTIFSNMEAIPTGNRNEIVRLFIAHSSDLVKFRKMLSKYGRERLIILFSHGLDWYSIADTIRFWDGNHQSLPDSPVNFMEIHDRVCGVGAWTKRNLVEKFDLKNKTKILELDGCEVDGLKIVVPKTNTDLAEWSDSMHNCVRSYGGHINNGHCSILGIYKEGKIKYNVSVLPTKRIEQFFAACNQPPDFEDKKKVVDFLVDKEIIYKEVPIPEHQVVIDDLVF